MWYVLDSIQDDINRLSSKSDEQLVATTRLVENLNSVTKQVVELNHLITKDNGKPCVVSQLNSVTAEVKELKSMLASVQKQVGVKTPEELRLERMKTIGRVAGAVAAVAPGIIAFIHVFL
jgi:wyosine [tRNA(Phe)-imidazoG37] synthetase (radical SAM superfamily)